MAKIVTETHQCDRCKEPLERTCSLIIENMSFTMSGYDPRGFGGAKHKGLEFCYRCSNEFVAWVFPDKQETAAQGAITAKRKATA